MEVQQNKVWFQKLTSAFPKASLKVTLETLLIHHDIILTHIQHEYTKRRPLRTPYATAAHLRISLGSPTKLNSQASQT